jgi:hypothetical protein
LHENREISCLAAQIVAERSASGRRGVEADDERAGEVRPLYSVLGSSQFGRVKVPLESK